MANNNFNKENTGGKDFYNNSSLKNNIITELCNEITSNENIDINVEKVTNKLNSTLSKWEIILLKIS